jgi:dTDP-L-rhamnose 4-epimerase
VFASSDQWHLITAHGALDVITLPADLGSFADMHARAHEVPLGDLSIPINGLRSAAPPRERRAAAIEGALGEDLWGPRSARPSSGDQHRGAVCPLDPAEGIVSAMHSLELTTSSDGSTVAEALSAEMAASTLPNKRVLITGGAGFIGSALARALTPHTDDVVLLDSLHPDVHGENPQEPEIPRARFIHGDVTSPQVWHKLLEEFSPTAIVHLAAETGTGLSLSEATRHGYVNVVGTTTMLDALFRSPQRPEHIVLASSRAVYGEGQWQSDDQTFYAEPRTHDDLSKSRWDPESPSGGSVTPIPSQAGRTEPRPTNIYAATKLAQENVLSAWAAATGTSLSVLRLQNVYGPGQSLINSYTGILALFSRLAVLQQQIDLYEDGCALRDFVYIGDVVQALIRTLVSPPQRNRTIDIGSGTATTLAQVAEIMIAQEDAPKPIVSGRFREGDVRAASCYITAATTEVGYQPAYTLEAGLGELLSWVRGEVGSGKSLRSS